MDWPKGRAPRRSREVCSQGRIRRRLRVALLQRGNDPPPVVTTCGDFVFGAGPKGEKQNLKERMSAEFAEKRRGKEEVQEFKSE